MTLTRSKEEMTGSSQSRPCGCYANQSIARAAAAGAEILVYVGGQLAFTGDVDKRKGTGSKKGQEGTEENNKEPSGATMSTNIGPDEYTIKLTARGKTKKLIDSPHQ